MGQQNGYSSRDLRSSNLFILLQKLIPKHLISRIIGKIAASENRLVKTVFISVFKRIYNVSLDNAKRKTDKEYHSFNDFFSRHIELPTNSDSTDKNIIYSPAEGSISEIGKIQDGQLLQAKGQTYYLNDLTKVDSKAFLNGSFITIYLSPSNYHRVHLPVSAQLQKTISIPGSLYSVNNETAQSIKDLFCKNERLVCQFSTPRGPVLVILVGALIVASIETNWEGPLSPYKDQQTNNYDLDILSCEEIGRFLLGSTVICCFPPNHFILNEHLKIGTELKACSPIGSIS